jgi:hypothetical protein
VHSSLHEGGLDEGIQARDRGGRSGCDRTGDGAQPRPGPGSGWSRRPQTCLTRPGQLMTAKASKDFDFARARADADAKANNRQHTDIDGKNKQDADIHVKEQAEPEADRSRRQKLGGGQEQEHEREPQQPEDRRCPQLQREREQADPVVRPPIPSRDRAEAQVADPREPVPTSVGADFQQPSSARPARRSCTASEDAPGFFLSDIRKSRANSLIWGLNPRGAPGWHRQ